MFFAAHHVAQYDVCMYQTPAFLVGVLFIWRLPQGLRAVTIARSGAG
ncbi:Uncharacterised protein [Shimwellia blattae]|nr:Uncharacterised protein [Shimwellia blattae]